MCAVIWRQKQHLPPSFCFLLPDELNLRLCLPRMVPDFSVQSAACFLEVIGKGLFFQPREAGGNSKSSIV